jgi:hypothetical protein
MIRTSAECSFTGTSTDALWVPQKTEVLQENQTALQALVRIQNSL